MERNPQLILHSIRRLSHIHDMIAEHGDCGGALSFNLSYLPLFHWIRKVDVQW